jgi:hypothetical protein
MDFPLSLTLVLMLDRDDDAAPSSGELRAPESVDSARGSGVFAMEPASEDVGLSERVA